MTQSDVEVLKAEVENLKKGQDEMRGDVRGHSQKLDALKDGLHGMGDRIAERLTEQISAVKADIDRELTSKIQLAVSTCENKNHSQRESSGSIKINLTNAKPMLKWLIYILLTASGFAGGSVAMGSLGAQQTNEVQHDDIDKGDINGDN